MTDEKKVISGKGILKKIESHVTGKGKECYRVQIDDLKGFIWKLKFGDNIINLKGEEVVYYAEQKGYFTNFISIFKGELK